MKFDRLIAAMTEGDVSICLSACLRDHLSCECVDRRDPDIHADHLADVVMNCLRYDPDLDDLSDFVLKVGKYALAPDGDHPLP